MIQTVYWNQEFLIDDEYIEVEITAVLEGSHEEGWDLDALYLHGHREHHDIILDRLWAEPDKTLERAVEEIWD